jgi:hypothetical protein
VSAAEQPASWVRWPPCSCRSCRSPVPAHLRPGAVAAVVVTRSVCRRRSRSSRQDAPLSLPQAVRGGRGCVAIDDARTAGSDWVGGPGAPLRVLLSRVLLSPRAPGRVVSAVCRSRSPCLPGVAGACRGRVRTFPYGQCGAETAGAVSSHWACSCRHPNTCTSTLMRNCTIAWGSISVSPPSTASPALVRDVAAPAVLAGTSPAERLSALRAMPARLIPSRPAGRAAVDIPVEFRAPSGHVG